MRHNYHDTHARQQRLIRFVAILGNATLAASAAGMGAALLDIRPDKAVLAVAIVAGILVLLRGSWTAE